MYHPSRGGVRGGSDQFTWDSVKLDKHRENYLGHSIMAPVGRWQKGKDLSWYAKERKSGDPDLAAEKLRKIAAIKKAEEDAMLVALGFKSAEKEEKAIDKEEMAAVLKRNLIERDDKNTERIEGVGIESGRLAMMSGGNKQSDGVMFESFKNNHNSSAKRKYEDGIDCNDKKKSKPCKKLKKEKKNKQRERKHKKRSSSREMSERDVKRHKHKKRSHRH